MDKVMDRISCEREMYFDIPARVSMEDINALMQSKFKCCICGGEFYGYGNNPAPIGNVNERCCNHCDMAKVIPARLSRYKKGDFE